GGRTGLFPLARLDVLAAFLPARTADELVAGFLAVLDDQRFATLRTALAGLLVFLGRHPGLGRRQRLGERAPELVQDLPVREFAVLDFVQLLLHVACELHVKNTREVLYQQVIDDLADFGRKEAPVLLLDVAAHLNGGNDRGIGARPANAFLFQGL